MVQVLNEAVLVNQIPILGICAVQLMANFSEEHGVHSGLGWIPGRVVRLDLPSSVAVHMSVGMIYRFFRPTHYFRVLIKPPIFILIIATIISVP